MIHVLRKDFLAYGSYFGLGLFYLLIFSVCFRDMAGMGQTLGICLAVYMVVCGSIQYDEKNRVDCLLRVLPIAPAAAPLEKYVLADLSLLASWLVCGILGLAGKLLPGGTGFFPLLGWEAPCHSFLVVSLLCGIFIPLYYRFDATRGRWILMLIQICVFMVMGGSVAVVGIAKVGGSRPAGWMLLAGAAIGLAFQAVGYLLARRVYLRKEL